MNGADRLCNEVLDGERLSDLVEDASLTLRVGIGESALPTRSVSEDSPRVQKKEGTWGGTSDTNRKKDDFPLSSPNPALDPDLTRLVRAWPYLPSSTRTAMLELLDADP